MSQDLLQGVFYDSQRNHHLMPELMGIKAGANSKEGKQNKIEGVREMGWNYQLSTICGSFYVVVCFRVLGTGHLNKKTYIGMLIKQWPLLELAQFLFVSLFLQSKPLKIV